MPTNSRRIVKDTDPIMTSNATKGLMNKEQVKSFIKMVFDATTFGSIISHELHAANKGEIDKIGVGKRLLRKKVENTDSGERAGINTGSVEWNVNKLRVMYEITNDYLRENIEGARVSDTIMSMFAQQAGLDTVDLSLNGDEATPNTDPDYAFLSNDDGFVKQILNGGHVYDAQNEQLSLAIFGRAQEAIPEKYNRDEKMRVIANPSDINGWRYLLASYALNGGNIPDNMYTAPAGVPFHKESFMPKGKMITCDPKNLTNISTYNMIFRNTGEGTDLVGKDKTLFCLHFTLDSIIKEIDATGAITNFISPLNFVINGNSGTDNGSSGSGNSETPVTPSYTYTEVENPTGNPSTSGYYEKDGDVYTLSEDTEVDAEKTYYTRSES